LTASDDGCDVHTLAAGFHAGTTIAGHHCDCGQLVFAASGVMLVITEGTACLIRPTRAIWIPASQEHRITCAVKSLCERSIIVYPE
jgi:quercetin dioxygenase-like cupin family protein